MLSSRKKSFIRGKHCLKTFILSREKCALLLVFDVICTVFTFSGFPLICATMSMSNRFFYLTHCAIVQPSWFDLFLKGVCDEIIYSFFLDYNPYGPLINRLKPFMDSDLILPKYLIIKFENSGYAVCKNTTEKTCNA